VRDSGVFATPRKRFRGVFFGVEKGCRFERRGSASAVSQIHPQQIPNLLETVPPFQLPFLHRK
jgi:hypothetical protein